MKSRSFSEKSLKHILRFAESFPDERIVSALMRQLNWTRFFYVEYLTALSPKDLLRVKLHKDIAARKRLENKGEEGIKWNVEKSLERPA